MLKFYKEQVEELKVREKELNKNISNKENSYKAEIKALEEKNIKELDKAKAELQEKLNSKYELELEKKEIEIEKLKNMINQLQDKLKEKKNSKNWFWISKILKFSICFLVGKYPKPSNLFTMKR